MIPLYLKPVTQLWSAVLHFEGSCLISAVSLWFLSGSATLHAWQQLAQPNLGGILDARPGVVTKGFRHLQLDVEEVYNVTDLEEDEPGEHQKSRPTLSISGLGSLPCSPSSNLYRQVEQHRGERRGAQPELQEMGRDAQDEEEEMASGEGVS